MHLYSHMLGEIHEAALFEFVGKRIRKRRRDRGHTQEELAKLISLSRTSVTNIEKGRQRLPLHQLLHVAEVLDCELHDLLPRRAELGLGTETLATLDLPVVGKITPEVERLLSRITHTRRSSGDES